MTIITTTSARMKNSQRQATPICIFADKGSKVGAKKEIREERWRKGKEEWKREGRRAKEKKKRWTSFLKIPSKTLPGWKAPRCVSVYLNKPANVKYRACLGKSGHWVIASEMKRQSLVIKNKRICIEKGQRWRWKIVIVSVPKWKRNRRARWWLLFDWKRWL